jgi:hypothetical protein
LKYLFVKSGSRVLAAMMDKARVDRGKKRVIREQNENEN